MNKKVVVYKVGTPAGVRMFSDFMRAMEFIKDNPGYVSGNSNSKPKARQAGPFMLRLEYNYTHKVMRDGAVLLMTADFAEALLFAYYCRGKIVPILRAVK